jgi:hypothetical protein
MLSTLIAWSSAPANKRICESGGSRKQERAPKHETD